MEILKEGVVGVGEITQFDAAGYKATLAAEVKNFNAKEYMDVKAARRMERFSQFAVAAAMEAMKQSGMDMSKETHIGWDFPLAAESAVCLVWKKRNAGFWIRVLPESVL